MVGLITIIGRTMRSANETVWEPNYGTREDSDQSVDQLGKSAKKIEESPLTFIGL